jgi:hypothetical protein
VPERFDGAEVGREVTGGRGKVFGTGDILVDRDCRQALVPDRGATAVTVRLWPDHEGGRMTAMTSSTGLLAVCVDVAILVTLVLAVASPRASHLARLLIATLAFTCAWLVTAVVGAMRAPDWTIYLGGGLIAASIAVIIVTLHLWTQEGELTDSGPGHRDDHGGGGPRRRRPDAPQPGGGGGDPSWWPEFERQLALYLAGCEGKRQTVVAPAEPARHPITRVPG